MSLSNDSFLLYDHRSFELDCESFWLRFLGFLGPLMSLNFQSEVMRLDAAISKLE